MRSLDLTGFLGYRTHAPYSPLMDPQQFFFEASLQPDDAVIFAKAFEACIQLLGKDSCWCLRARSHQIFTGFIISHGSKLLYKNQDARPLLLAMSGRYHTDERPVIVRRACCTSLYCLNPAHYYYGTRADVALELKAKKQSQEQPLSPVTGEIADKIRQGHDAGETILELSRKYKLSYHVARRLCSENTYKDYNGNFSEKYLERLWQKTVDNCAVICQTNPDAVKTYNLAYHVANQLECPWHRKGVATHKGNFGLMGECLDCMEEIRNGRCSVDVTKFDSLWYWTVKRFWDNVDIKGEDECWPWLGKTRRNNSESLAYFPSPFHSGKTQSAPRVAFWVSRGYTGKYRIFNKPDCSPFCCNPKHLMMRELNDLPIPDKISEIRLNYGNIFEHYRENHKQIESDSADKLPSA